MDFSTLAEHKSKNIRGTGLGLSICKKIIQKMGGKVVVDSEIGVGTTFSISISTKCKVNSQSKVIEVGPDPHQLRRRSVHQPIMSHKFDISSLPVILGNDSSEALVGQGVIENLSVLVVNDEQICMMGLELMFTRKLGVKREMIGRAYNGLEAY